MRQLTNTRPHLSIWTAVCGSLVVFAEMLRALGA